jgi:hypothetical protein
LYKTGRSTLSGIILVSLSILVERNEQTISFKPIVTIEVVRNPNYFADVEFITDPDRDDPRLIRQPLRDIDAAYLITKHISDTLTESLEKENLASIPNDRSKDEQLVTLQDNPEANSIIFVSRNKTMPLFKGHGNINFHCGNCNSMLIERGWRQSIYNIFIQCPLCGTYCLFPPRDTRAPNTWLVGVAYGEYNLESTILLKRGVSLEGGIESPQVK